MSSALAGTSRASVRLASTAGLTLRANQYQFRNSPRSGMRLKFRVIKGLETRTNLLYGSQPEVSLGIGIPIYEEETRVEGP
jgi:hypothetical protein